MTTIARSLDKLHRDKLVNMRKGNMFYAHPGDITEEDGFNPRNYETPAMVEHIRALADAYKAGRFVDPIVVQVKDSKIIVRDGHCRLRGMRLAMEEGADLGQVAMLEFKGDDDDADALILTSQSGKKLTPLEVASMYNRMQNRGKTVADIAQMVGKTGTHVSVMLEMHTLPREIKSLVDDGVVSATLALKTYNEMGSSAIELLQDGVEEVLRSGKKKLTLKHLPKAEGTKPRAATIKKPVVMQMAKAVRSLGDKLEGLTVTQGGTATLELTAEEIEELRKIRDSLPTETLEEESPEEERQEGSTEQPASTATQ